MKTPWHYLTWTPPQLEAQAERNLAAITRRKGWLWAVLLHWGVVEGEALGWNKLRIFLDHNYAGLALGGGVWIAAWLGLPEGGALSSRLLLWAGLLQCFGGPQNISAGWFSF